MASNKKAVLLDGVHVCHQDLVVQRECPSVVEVQGHERRDVEDLASLVALGVGGRLIFRGGQPVIARLPEGVVHLRRHHLQLAAKAVAIIDRDEIKAIAQIAQAGEEQKGPGRFTLKGNLRYKPKTGRELLILVVAQ